MAVYAVGLSRTSAVAQTAHENIAALVAAHVAHGMIYVDVWNTWWLVLPGQLQEFVDPSAGSNRSETVVASDAHIISRVGRFPRVIVVGSAAR